MRCWFIMVKMKSIRPKIYIILTLKGKKYNHFWNDQRLALCQAGHRSQAQLTIPDKSDDQTASEHPMALLTLCIHLTILPQQVLFKMIQPTYSFCSLFLLPLQITPAKLTKLLLFIMFITLFMPTFWIFMVARNVPEDCCMANLTSCK